MKKLNKFLLVAALMMVASTLSFAQGRYGKDSAECVNALNFYKNFMDQGNMSEANYHFQNAFKYCPPKVSQNLFINGAKIMKSLLQNEKDAARRARLIDTLILINDVRANNFPKNALKAKEAQLRDIMTYYPQDDPVVIDKIDEFHKMAGVKMNPDFYLAALDRAINLYKAGKYTDDQVISTYTKFSPYIEELVAADGSELNLSTQKSFENMFIVSGVANCDNLVKVFGPRVNANPNDLDLAKSVAKMLSSAECIDTDLFLKTVTTMHQLEPSYASAKLLYKLYRSKDNDEKALTYLQMAVESPDVVAAEKGSLLYEMSMLYFKAKNNGKAVMYAKQAADSDASYAGKCYMLMGTIWMQVKCTGDEMDARAKFWVATDYFQKAKAADATIADEADKLMSQCRVYFPKVEDAFMYDLQNGSPYSISCSGMSASTTVRTNK